MPTELQRLGRLLARPTASSARPAASSSTTLQPPEPDEESLLSQVGGGAISAVGAVGNALDLFGSMVRDTLALENPFDQWLTPFSGENRTTGRELLTKWGLTSQNKETGIGGWLDDPMEGVADVGGFLTELGTDPLGWITGGATTASQMAAKRAAGYAPGIRGGLDRLGDVVTAADPGTHVGRLVNRDQWMNKRLGELATGTKNLVAESRIGKKLAPPLKKARLHWNQAFDRSVREASTEAGQKKGRIATEIGDGLRTEYQERIVPVLSVLGDEVARRGEDAGEFTLQVGRTMRDVLEAKGDDAFATAMERLPEPLREPVFQLKEYQKQILHRAVRAGVNVGELTDDVIEFAHRQMSDHVEEYINKNTLYGTASGRASGPEGVSIKEHQAQRIQLLKDSNTNVLNTLTGDNVAHDMLDDLLPGTDQFEEGIAVVAQRLRELAGDDMLPDVKVFDTKKKRWKMQTDTGETLWLTNKELNQLDKSNNPFGGLYAGADDLDSIPPNVRDVFDEVAMDNELDTKMLYQAAEQEYKLEKDFYDSWEDALKYARKSTGLNKTKIRKMMNDGLDHNSVHGFDKLKDELVNDNPQLDWGPDPANTLWEKLAEGKQPAPKIDDDGIIQRALRFLEENPQVVPDEVNGGAKVVRTSYERTLKGSDGEEITQTLQHVMEDEDRATLLARHMFNHPIYRETGGLFSNHVLADATSGFRAASRAIENAESTTQVLSDGFESGILRLPMKTRAEKLAAAKEGFGNVTLGSLMDKPEFLKLNRDHVYNAILARNPDKFADLLEAVEEGGSLNLREYMDQLGIQVDVAKDLVRGWEFGNASPDTPGVQGAISNAFRSMTALFKTGVLTAPARYTRDLVSGMAANVYNNMYSNTAAFAAWDALLNRPNVYLTEIPQVQEYLKAAKLEVNAENATRAIREMYAARRGHASSLYRDFDNRNAALESSSDIEQMMEVFPGMSGIQPGAKSAGTEILATMFGRRRPVDPKTGKPISKARAYLDPHGVAGFNRSKRTTQPIAQAGNLLGKHTDDMNRLVPFIELLRRGETADDAMKAINRVQLNYDPRTFTATEQALKKVFPFYSFASRQLAYVGTELLTNPAGRLGKLIRVGRHMQNEDEYLPEHVRNQGAIPAPNWLAGKPTEGVKNYITGLGLMFEDTLNLLAPESSSEAFRTVIGRTNPLIKGPVEWATGVSTFHGGPLGGRSLHDMDPVIGRIFTELGLQKPLPGDQAAPAFGSRALEFISANSPASRVVSSVRTALDGRRKSKLARAVNLLTGLRITSVSPEQRQRGLRDLANATARDLGARSFETFHISDDLIESAEGANQDTLKAIKALRKLADKRRREQKKAEKEQQS